MRVLPIKIEKALNELMRKLIVLNYGREFKYITPIITGQEYYLLQIICDKRKMDNIGDGFELNKNLEEK